jgi:hypothetical protein
MNYFHILATRCLRKRRPPLENIPKLTECCICLDYIEKDHVQLLPCQHYFHVYCLFDWLHEDKRRATCLLCTQSVKRFILDSYIMNIRNIRTLKKSLEDYIFDKKSKTPYLVIHINDYNPIILKWSKKNKNQLKNYFEEEKYIQCFRQIMCQDSMDQECIFFKNIPGYFYFSSFY